MDAGDHLARQEQIGHVGLVGLRVVRRHHGLGVDHDAEPLQHRGVRMIAGQQEHRVGRQHAVIAGMLDHDLGQADLDDSSLEVGGHRPFLDAVLHVGPDPVLDATPQLGAPVHQRHTRAGAVQIERGFGSGVLAANNEDPPAEILVRITQMRSDVRKIFSRDTKASRLVGPGQAPTP